MKKHFPEYFIHDEKRPHKEKRNEKREKIIANEGLSVTKKDYSVKDYFKSYDSYGIPSPPQKMKFQKRYIPPPTKQEYPTPFATLEDLKNPPSVPVKKKMNPTNVHNPLV